MGKNKKKSTNVVAQEQKPFMCLNMIVRDEAHIIQETLESISPYVDYYVISDTGSVDNTIELIKSFMGKKGIPGEVHSNEWKDFGHNRSLALKLARDKSQYVWVIDADDIIVGDLKLPKDMKADSYTLNYGDGFSYHRAQIFKNTNGVYWKYVGVLHEYPACNKTNQVQEHIEGNYYIDSRRLGARSKDPKKYLKDALVFEKALKDEPNNERYVFYMAQSYMDYGDIHKGIENYKRRIKMGGWFEEIYYSYYRIAEGLSKLKSPWPEVEQAYLECYDHFKDRAEPLYHIAKHYRENKDYIKGYSYAKKASLIPFPAHCKLFIHKDIYDFDVWDELSFDAFHIGKYLECYELCKKLLNSKHGSEDDQKRINNLMNRALEAMKADENSYCAIYLGNLPIDNDPTLNSIVNSFSISYNVIIVGNRMARSNEKAVYCSCSQFKKYYDRYDFKFILMYGSINMLIDNSYDIKYPIILFQNTDMFRYICDNDIIFDITNSEMLIPVFEKIKMIVCSTSEIHDKLLQKKVPSEFMVVWNDNSSYRLLDQVSCKYVPNIDYDASYNGFEIVVPKYFQKLYAYKGTGLNKGLAMDIYFELIKLFPERPEPSYYAANYMFSRTEYQLAMAFYDKAIKLCDSGKWSVFADVIKIQKAKCLNKMEKYQESFNLANDVLKTDLIPENLHWDAIETRDINLDHISNWSLAYPKQKIEMITKNMKNKTEINIMFSMTTCKRYDLFEKTVNSFINCCKDIDKIDMWLCVDDNSNTNDCEKMKDKYPFFTFVFKNKMEKGHVKSMNIIRDKALSVGAKYLLHQEDDFHFVYDRQLITPCIEILEHDLKVGQVLFNRNYAEVDFSKIRIPGGYPKKTTSGMRYIEHEHYKRGTHEYQMFEERNKGYGTCGYWPHFSFRPSVLRVDMLKDVGRYVQTPHFEMEFANEYYSRGWKSCFLDDFVCTHIGKKTWENSSTNAYSLNQIDQFTMDDKFINIKIFSDNLDKYRQFKDLISIYLPHLVREPLDQITWTNEEQMTLFANNEFAYERKRMTYLWKAFEQWRHNESKYLVIMYDFVQPTSEFKERFEKILNMLKLTPSFDMLKLSDNDEPIAYILTNEGCKKLTNTVNEYGFTSTINDIVKKSNLKIQTVPITTGNFEPFPTVEMEQRDGFEFLSEVDSYGNDISFVGMNKSVDELVEICKNTKKCVGFNTNGWLKEIISPRKSLVHLHGSNNKSQGLYILKQ